jgi:regulatory protein
MFGVDSDNPEQAKLLAQARDKAIGLLARREHSRYELRQKLRAFHDQIDVDSLLDDLAELGLQCDARYAGVLVRSKAQSGYGIQRIRQWAKQNGVAQNDLYLALEELDHDWFEAARMQRQKHYGLLPPDSMQAKAKQMRYLYNRGFSQDQIQYAMDAEQGDEAFA